MVLGYGMRVRGSGRVGVSARARVRVRVSYRVRVTVNCNSNPSQSNRWTLRNKKLQREVEELTEAMLHLPASDPCMPTSV